MTPATKRFLGVRTMALVALFAAAACGPTASPTPSRGTQSPSPPATPSRPVASPTTALSPTSTPTPLDLARLAVTLQPFATVPGGPLAFTAPADGSGRLFVAAQDGTVWVIDDGRRLAAPLLDVSSLITTGGERGLLGIAVHPRFPQDPRVFVDYTNRSGDSVIASYRLDPADANRLDPSSRVQLLVVGQPYANHNGGALAFGPDGDLYISLGDGGGGGDPQGNGQRLDTTLAKILRIDVDHASNGRAYAIPAGNPFTGDPLAHPEIWLYGLRNPWRMSFDRETGDLWIGDVGQGAWEEVDVARAGKAGLDFGWNRMEGAHCYSPREGCDQSGLTMPVTEYGHPEGCVVIGGPVYRGTVYPAFRGAYLFADYCSGQLYAIDAATNGPTPPVKVGTTGEGLAAFGEDETGEVYAANLDGTISKVILSSR